MSKKSKANHNRGNQGRENPSNRVETRPGHEDLDGKAEREDIDDELAQGDVDEGPEGDEGDDDDTLGPDGAARESFLPGPVPQAPQAGASSSASPSRATIGGDGVPKVVVELVHKGGRSYDVVLTVEPLEAVREPIHLPPEASPEQLAAVIAGTLQRAAHSAYKDGEYRHYQNEAAKEEARLRSLGRW